MSNVVDQDFQKKWNAMIIDLATGKNSGFHMTVLSQLRAVMTTEVEVAATDGLHLFINPIRWGAYSPSMRMTILIHELWHVIGEHSVRVLDFEDKELFAKAADFVINDMLAQHNFKMNAGLLDKRFHNITVDDVYKILFSELPPPPPSSGQGQGQPQQSSAPCDQSEAQNQQSDDIENSSEKEEGTNALSGGKDVLTPEQGKAILDKMAANGQPLQDAYGDSVQPHPAAGDAQMTQKHLDETVMQAYMQEIQQSGGEPGMFPADLRLLIDKLTKPIIPWYIHLRKYMQVFVRKHFSYSRLRKQYQPDFILPSLQGKELSKIASAFDISGSVTDEQVMKFNSEMAYIQNKLHPKELEIVSFDTHIHDQYILKKGQKLNGMEFHGRGGTSLHCVFDHFNSLPKRKQPKLLIVFSDLFCAKITKKPNFDVIWICFDNPNAEVDFGKLIHVDSHNDYK